ncbi:hypothetical protein PMKS-003037 [Pichia membranifaciens]|uniref:EF-hand domain-containing protein n=1 Tax=Pichia membranifaciens TaxID=4926 RepID=A0A1Q2YJ06_9ASCO|nr:hypothetical protein PMKS-003037 [Pichia membranifaciens]
MGGHLELRDRVEDRAGEVLGGVHRGERAQQPAVRDQGVEAGEAEEDLPGDQDLKELDGRAERGEAVRLDSRQGQQNPGVDFREDQQCRLPDPLPEVHGERHPLLLYAAARCVGLLALDGHNPPGREAAEHHDRPAQQEVEADRLGIGRVLPSGHGLQRAGRVPLPQGPRALGQPPAVRLLLGPLVQDAEEAEEGEERTFKVSGTIKEIATPKSKGEFSEFFGPNILNKASAIAQHDYDMPLKLRIETFLVISARILHVKNNFLARLEKLLLEIVNLLGQFAEYESYDYEKVSQSPPSSFFSAKHYKPEDLKFKGRDLFELEKQITNTTEETDELSETLQQAIKSISFVTNFRNSTRQKIYEQFIELEIYKCQLSDMLQIYGLKHFTEPPEKSFDKISRFIELLKKSEMTVYSNASDYIERNIDKIEKSFYENHSSLFDALALVESDLINANAISDFDERTKELENIMQDIPGLKELHLRTVSFWHDLEMINSSLARGFDKQSYKSIINEQRYKLTFLENCIDKSIKFMTSLKTQKDEASEVLNIAKTAQQYENSKAMQAISKDKRQLKTHLLVHRLIQRRFHFNKNINPIQVLFDRHDNGSKGYLTKSEFKKAFLVAYPGTATLVGVDEVDTIFETSYETVGKMRRGIEFPQFKAVIELGNTSKGSEAADMDDFAAALQEDDCEDAKETTSISSTNSSIDRLLHQIENEKLQVDLTNDVFYNSFEELCSNKDVLEPRDMDTIHLHPILRANLESIFPDHKYREWFQHVDQSSIYQDNEDGDTVEAGFGGHPREIALKNVLYDLEKVDLSKI